MSGDQDLYLQNQLCFKLYTASRLVIRGYQPMLKDLGITYPQYLVLLVLWQAKEQEELPLSLKALGARLHLDSGTLTPLLKRMQQLGLISRVRSEQDERQLQIALTEQGIALAPKAKKWRETLREGLACQQQMLTQMAQQLDQFIGLLEKE
ncbi:MarR family transcriptional regulator [Pseudoalteromonas sp. BDTF-M6]|uniref:MarR family winged helix-turn-helix transcriptional regulator n=1 Tax=Pseudoalteromonas sp. BDTF-M6 TaxID=2796132 RepID=UPI001BAF0E46|nr:MarR family transcriptional regulator [Pseudoalteromonas sp. BDTF-M6]MBS3797861.1 MarR family transcriptional regulator [Pseudoalteromonas sp. BDTF-M6]